MIDARLLSKTTERLSALDFSEENGRIAEIEAENARMDNAIAEAERRCAEIEVLTTKKVGRDPADIADALLEGGLKEAIKAGIDDEALKEERLTLRRAITELRGRQTANFNAIVEVQQSVNGRISDALAPLADALLAIAREAGEKFVQAWAGLSALHSMGLSREVSASLRAADNVVGTLHTSFGFLGSARYIDTPAEIINALRPLASAGKAVGGRAHPDKSITIYWK
jgi:hypothetical protein